MIQLFDTGEPMLSVQLWIGTAIAMRTAVPIDLYCYADIDYTVIAVCYKTHLIAYDGYWLQYCDKDKICFSVYCIAWF